LTELQLVLRILDVTKNIRTIHSIPLKLKGNYPKEVEIRGEIIMPHSVFDELNVEREAAGEQKFANCRNASSGSLKHKRPKEVAKRKLAAYFFQVVGDDMCYDNALTVDTHYARMGKAKEWGMPVHDAFFAACSIQEVLEYINNWDTARKNLPFDIDGIVIKIDNIEHQKELGFTSKSPRWSISFKFQAESVCTKLLSVIFQIGKTGVCTPVAELEPVQLSGSVIRKSSLYNEDQIQTLDLKIGDMVFIEKGGEVIPKVTGVDFNQRDKNVVEIVFPKCCPECGGEIIRKDGEASHYCLNEEECPPQIKGKIEHFVSRKAMYIDSVGEKLIELLYNEGLVKNIADLYDLKWENLAVLERMGEISAKKAIESIKNSTEISAEKVLYAIGIRYVGSGSSKRLMKHFGNIYDILNASREELLQVEDIGETTAGSIVDFFKNESYTEDNVSNSNWEIINRLKAAGLNFELCEEDEEKASSNKLEGLTITLSGKFEMSRDDLKKLIESHGGKNGSGISKNTDYFLMGEKCGPSKIVKVEKLNIPIISEEELFEMISD